MKITLRSCPIICVQYFRTWLVFSSTIFMWYLQEQLACKVKLSKGTKGEFAADSPQVITWSWNVAALNSPSILFKVSKTCVDISSLLTTSKRLLFLKTDAVHNILTFEEDKPTTLLKISFDNRAYFAYQKPKSVAIPEWSYHHHSKDWYHTSAYSTYEKTHLKHFLSKNRIFRILCIPKFKISRNSWMIVSPPL